MNYLKKISGLFCFALILFSTLTFASPSLPMSLYGSVVNYNSPAKVDSLISVIDNRGQICGSYLMSTPGKFGLLNCLSYNSTGDGRGSFQGELISVRVNGFPASVIWDNDLTTLNSLNWNSGEFKELTVIRPQLVCGDGFCDNYENCGSCPQDCGVCVDPPKDETSSPSSSIVGNLPPSAGDSPLVTEDDEFVCEEEWICSDWGTCQKNNLQIRDCVDLNDCGTDFAFPETSQYCEYLEDLLIDNGEDNFTTILPELNIPLAVTFCVERMPFFSFPSLTFIFLTIFAIAFRLYFYYRYIKKLKINPRFTDVEKLKKEFISSQKKNLFLITILILAFVIYIYHYFFYMCKESYFNNSFLLLLFVVIAPFLNHFVLFLLGSTKKDLKRKFKVLEDSHYQHVLRLLSIVNDKLLISEEEITSSLKNLEQDSSFHILMEELNSLKRISLDFRKLKSIYKDGKPATIVEKDLLENINVLLGDDLFNKKCEEISGLRKLGNSLSSLYKSYEYKQDLYFEMLKIESDFENKTIIDNSDPLLDNSAADKNVSLNLSKQESNSDLKDSVANNQSDYSKTDTDNGNNEGGVKNEEVKN